ncbi:MAG: hypothetical protein QOH93_162 [Chloroflexia bacterium]|jgi:hypothetical protein|nr:hypothetical protein [Chloroflexia bacterium]
MPRGADTGLLEKALDGARLLYAYTMYVKAPLDRVFRFTGDPDYWTRDFDGKPLAKLALEWDGPPFRPGSIMTLAALRKDGTTSSVGAVRLELLYFERNVEISYRYLTGSHLIYRFVYEDAGARGTEFTVNALVDAQSGPMNNLRQRLYAKRRRRQAVQDHLRVKSELEARAR